MNPFVTALFAIFILCLGLLVYLWERSKVVGLLVFACGGVFASGTALIILLFELAGGK